MDKTIEEDFVNRFIKKDMKDRLLFELCPKEKRSKAIGRLSHGAEKIIKEDTVLKADPEMTFEEVFGFFQTKAQSGYLIGTNSDGSKIDLFVGLQACFNDYGGCLYFSGNYVFVKEEVDYGSPMKYILCG